MKPGLTKTLHALLLSAILTLSSMPLAGCGGDEKPQVAATQIPGPPTYLQPINAPKMKLGDDIRVHNNKRAGIIKRLNSIIRKAIAERLQLQNDLAAPGK